MSLFIFKTKNRRFIRKKNAHVSILHCELKSKERRQEPTPTRQYMYIDADKKTTNKMQSTNK